jgi:hypothetical protein
LPEAHYGKKDSYKLRHEFPVSTLNAPQHSGSTEALFQPSEAMGMSERDASAMRVPFASTEIFSAAASGGEASVQSGHIRR